MMPVGRLSAFLVVLSGLAGAVAAPADLERSYWVHASLALFPQKGYWGIEFAGCTPPSRSEVQHAAYLLCGTYAANRLYLVYHRELPVAAACELFAAWRECCPRGVELVPALVLRMYDRARTPVFAPAELAELVAFCRERINPRRMAVYDVLPNRDQGDGLSMLAKSYPDGLVRVGLQPDEAVAPPFVAAVQDTWSGFCHGRRNLEDWSQPGFGAETLRGWVHARNSGSAPVAWDLVVVAWDYRATGRGAYPGCDDAEKNDPLPAGRNRLGVEMIRATARPEVLAGFSSDLFILHENSRARAHDGSASAFYQTLRAGREYRGTYVAPLAEIAGIYRELRAGRWPTPLAD